MVFAAIRRVLSTWDTFKAEEKYAAGDFPAAWRLIEKAIARTGTKVLDPHLFKYQYLIKVGKLVEGLKIKKIVECEIDRRIRMTPEEANYIRYYLLRLLPDDYLQDLSKSMVIDPEEIGLEKVHSYVRTKYPYKKPTPILQKFLSDR